MSDAILLIDDDAAALRALGSHLEQQGLEVARELEVSGALTACDRLEPDVAILDLGVAGADGADLLALLRGRGIPVIGLLDVPDEPAALQAVRRGAEIVLPRSVSPELLTATAMRLAHTTQLRRAADAMLAGPVSVDALGTSVTMRTVAQQIGALAQSDRTTVLIQGEIGVGKGWVARLIHDLGARSREPFVQAWCSGTDAVALETRLFGTERGALPDVRRRVRGCLELAGRGTLLLREIASMPLELQPVLLRALESRSFRRVGGQRDVGAQARLIVTTSRNLEAEAESDRFRGDLHYRLSTMTLTVPPLRDRSDADRSALINGLHAALAERFPDPPPPFAPESMERLMTHTWPGNIRELAAVVERSALVARVAGQPAILIEHLPGELRARPGLGDRRHTPMSLEETERQQIERSLRFHGGNRTRAAKELRISRATLINKIKRYSITE